MVYSRPRDKLDPWCSGLTCGPVKAEIAGSNPVGSARVRVHKRVHGSLRLDRTNLVALQEDFFKHGLEKSFLFLLAGVREQAAEVPKQVACLFQVKLDDGPVRVHLGLQLLAPGHVLGTRLVAPGV